MYFVRLLSTFASALCVVGQSPEVSALKLRKMDGSIQEFRPSESPAMVVIFVSAACPMSTEYSERIIQLAVDYSRHGVRILVTNSNQNESDTEVEKQRVEAHLSIPIYRDDGAVAKILGAIATPTAVVIDRGGVTRYFGMIDNSRNPARATKHLLRSALDSVVAGRAVEIPRTKVMGCSIKSAL